MKKTRKIALILIILIILVVILGLLVQNDNTELKTIKSEKELSKIYSRDYYDNNDTIINILTMPFSLLYNGIDGILSKDYYYTGGGSGLIPGDFAEDSVTNSAQSTTSNTTSKDYSTTNIQVENVDEADITKTDGDYIYSISENSVVITDVRNPEEIKIASTLKPSDSRIPEELILYKNKLVVISSKSPNSSSSYSYKYNGNTAIRIYDIKNKENPQVLKSYELYEPYYTTRCINNMLYVIASGNLRKENDKIVRAYKENSVEKEIKLDDIKYLKEINTTKQTIISSLNLENVDENVNVSSYLIDISNAYVSENNIYLLNEKYEYNNYTPSIKSIFGLKGIFGAFDFEYEGTSGYHTEIYKFNIEKNGKISYNTKNKIQGRTINQYSLDEKNNHLRIALYDSEGARVAVLDEKLNKIGITDYLAKGEKMYSSRFIDNKAYLVTYKTMDPLFVVDLSNEKHPQVLGELEIPGYSTYLHPYDEDHIIGIGVETEEIVNRNSSGKVISTTARTIGMKMALFDVSDVENPVQISQTLIGDSRTTSAILTNPKALLFSKAKELIAIPVNNYIEDFAIDSKGETYSEIIDSFTTYNKSHIGEGYFVYNINLEDGFKLKGTITHEYEKKSGYYYYNSKLLRGLYIDNNLFTISENAVKVNNLDTLELIDELKIK